MERLGRTILGYHGCTRSFAEDLLLGRKSIDDWQPSKNVWDWLGHGIYFWEHAPARALAWAQRAKATRDEPDVLGAYIRLDECFDLTDVAYTNALKATFEAVQREYAAGGVPLPSNDPASEADQDRKRRNLDCLILNECIRRAESARTPVIFSTVRGPFWEGGPAFDGSAITREAHVQVAVRRPTCIIGVFLPRIEGGPQ